LTTNLYALLENRPGHERLGEPFYVGIGTAARPYTHFAHARTPKGCRNRLMQIVFDGHFAAGVDPVVRVLGTYETKDDAAEAEKSAIAHYGRMGIDPGGFLCNIAKGGQGPDAELMRRPEIAAKVSAAMRAHWATDAGRKQRETAAEEKWRSATTEERRQSTEAARAGSDASWASPERAEVRKAALRGVKKTRTAESDAARAYAATQMNTPEANAKKAAAAKARWADPEFRAKMAEKRKAAWQDPQKRANMLARKDGSTHEWREGRARDPEIRNEQRRDAYKAGKEGIVTPRRQTAPKSEGRSRNATAMNAAKSSEQRSAEQSTSWQDGGVRDKRLDGMKRAAQDPELKGRRVAAMLAGRARARAAKLAVSEARAETEGEH
jgi:hypothetical protein